jgi:hypothetical protein
MAIYAVPGTRRRDAVDEIGIDIRPVQGPPIHAKGWGDVLLYYWAQQVDFLDASGISVGAGHIGIQAYDNDDLPDDQRTVVNWGCYDNSVSGTFRSTNVLTPDSFIDINSPVSMGMAWEYGEWLRFRVFKSPKQDWLALEIKPGDNQVPPYVDTDQQADEVAFRCTIENVTRGRPPVEFHDVLVKSPRASKPIGDGQFWTEPIQQAAWPGDIDSDWPRDPICDFREWIFDGRGMAQTITTLYSGTSANCDTTVVSGSPGYVRQAGNVTRTNPDSTVLAVPTGYWDAHQPNVTPAITDVAARVPTPRPWF